jgi:chlorophyll/bacteriochlorophyll a synthase
MGLQSLPVAFGVDTAKWICVASIDATQLGIAAWLYSIGEPTYAAVLGALVLPQIFAQFKVSAALAVTSDTYANVQQQYL